jgi:hypothetical protein
MTKERRQLNHAIDVLHKRFEMVANLKKGYERPADADAEMEALRFAASILRRPYVPMNPFD